MLASTDCKWRISFWYCFQAVLSLWKFILCQWSTTYCQHFLSKHSDKALMYMIISIKNKKQKKTKQTTTKIPTNQKTTPQNKQKNLSRIRHWILLHTKMSRKLKVRWNFWKQTWNMQAKASPASPKNRHREKLMILTDFCKCCNPKLA